MNRKSTFATDFEKVLPYFPKLSCVATIKGDWIIRGGLDICDEEGNYWGTFQIRINIPKTYPYCIPEVIEESKIILRDEDWHINKNGICCLDIEHKLQIMSKKGIHLKHFIQDVIYPYFANQIYRTHKKEYAADSYRHGFDGVRDYYLELGISNANLAIEIIEGILNERIPQGNELCFCKKKKFKNCHANSVNELKSVSKMQLYEDLENFKRINPK